MKFMIMKATPSGLRQNIARAIHFTRMALFGSAIVVCGGATTLAADKETLNIYNWSDYIADDTVANFEKRSGVKVNYDVYDTNEILEAKLLAGNSGYDLVVPTNHFVERQIKAKIFKKINKDKIPNYKNLDPQIMKVLTENDPGNLYAIPYMWGTVGIAYNVDMVKKRLGNVPVDSWDIVFKPENANKLKDCGIMILDSQTEITPIAMNYIGISPYSEKPDDIKAAYAMLKQVRPAIRQFQSSQMINDLANGEICVAVGYSGDMLQAQTRAQEAKKGITVEYVIPKEGTLQWIDVLVIPADAKHPERAEAFINYFLEPKVTASISKKVSYANGNAKSLPHLDPAIRNNPGIYPSAAVKKKLFAAKAHSDTYNRLLTRSWTALKRGE